MMSSFLCINIHFLQPFCHGRGDADEPEWPPSPLRLFQALAASSAGHWNERTRLLSAVPVLAWLESLEPPIIAAGKAVPADNPYRLYVPDNVADRVAASWSRGNDADIADYRTEKDVRPMQLSMEEVSFLFPLPDDTCPFLDFLKNAARSITHLGWGIDMAVGDADIITTDQAAALPGLRWRPSPSGGSPLRVPKSGTLDDLIRKHDDFLNRLSGKGFHPVPPLRVFDIVRYRCSDQPLNRPVRLFELRNTDGSRFRYPHRKFIHIAGMMRHLAIEVMRDSGNWPSGVEADWVETFIAGHCKNGEAESPGEKAAGRQPHRQLSYLPLPSLGHAHADPGIRRVMIVAPGGDDEWLDRVARRLAGQTLKPVRDDEFPNMEPPLLVPLPGKGDGVTRCYTEAASVWKSFTPVILPGHDDHKPEKTRALIERALIQSGIDQPCDFEWSAFPYFRKSFSAYKYDKQKQLQGYIRPGYLMSNTAVHLTLRFHDGTDDKKPIVVPGPLAIGAGRHCGFGLMAKYENPNRE